MELQARYDDFRELGAVVWAISTDERERLAAFRDKEGIAFPLLLDPGAETIRRYGVFNDVGPTGTPIPHPTVVVTGVDGVVRYLWVDPDYKVRPAADRLLEAVRGAGGAGDEGDEGGGG